MFGKINMWKIDAMNEGYDEGIEQGRAESQKIIAEKDAYNAKLVDRIA